MIEGFSADAEQELERAVARAHALQADGARKAKARRFQLAQVLTEYVADGSLQRAVEPYPDGPAIFRRGHGCAAIPEPPGIKAAHRPGATEGHELREWDRLIFLRRVGEKRRDRQTQHAVPTVQVEEAARGSAVAQPRRARRTAHVRALLSLDFDARAGAIRRARPPRVERQEQVVRLRGVTLAE